MTKDLADQLRVLDDDPDENPWPGGVTISVTPPDLIFKDGFELPPGD